MADEEEKTEEASDKKIEKAREDGNVPKSQEVNGFVGLVVGLSVLFVLFPDMREHLMRLYSRYQTLFGQELSKNDVYLIAIELMKEFILIVLPITAVVGLAGILASVLQFGFIFSPKAVQPKFSKINPFKGLKNLFSAKKAVEGAKITFKAIVAFTIAYYAFKSFIWELQEVIFLPLVHQMVWLREKAMIIVAIMLLWFLCLALFDLFFTRYNYFKNLRMSKQEVKDEYKQMEGDPRVKQRIRQVQMEMLKKSSMRDVSSADVVITNPTHYAVALRYDTEQEQAPRVLAKGVDHMALRIKDIALEHSVEIVENPPLARQLYKDCEINDTIPENLFKAVAEVLAYVYQNKNKAKR